MCITRANIIVIYGRGFDIHTTTNYLHHHFQLIFFTKLSIATTTEIKMSSVNTPLSSLTSSGLVPLKPHFRIRTPIHPNTLNPTPRSSISGLTVVRRQSFQANPFDSRFELEDKKEELFWVSSAKEAIGGLKSLAMFLVEQPGQLKYIEWPSFQSTLKTASLTLVLVALLIVALSSVDSALSFLLALLLRKTA